MKALNRNMGQQKNQLSLSSAQIDDERGKNRMNITKKGFTALLLSLLLMILCLPAAVLGEDVKENTQEIFVTNTPIKGQIILEKKGMVLTGFVESQDSTGHTVYTPDYHEGYLEGAVYEVRAVEDIVGKEGTQWFKADEVAATITTTAEGKDESPLLPLGHYYITEKSAPAGYKLDENRYDVLLQAANQKTPVVVETVCVTDEFLPAKINFTKVKEVIVNKESDKGLVSSEIETVPAEGFVFGLYNHDEIKYADGTLPKGTLIAVAITDAEGKASFEGNFPHGHYTLKEISAPEGWKVNTASFHIDIDRKYLNDDGICEFTLETPIVDEIVHGTPRISKMDIAGSDYLPDTLIEVKNEEGGIVCRAYTGENGFVPAFPAVPGKYTYKEVLAPEGYELCVTEFSFTVKEDGQIEGFTTVSDDYTRFYVMKVDESNKPLAGVMFGLYAEDTNYLIKTAITDEKGFATFEKVPYGKYFIQEKEPLPGYVRDYTRVQVSVDGTFINPKEPLAVINNCPTEILMLKLTQDEKVLSGAEFGLFNEDGKQIMTTVSDKDGLIRFTHVEQGRYFVRETKAPDGYLLSGKENIVTVNEKYVNPEKPTKAFVNVPQVLPLRKTDTSGNPMAGIEFNLLNANTAEIIETATTDKDGCLTFTKFGYGDWIIREAKVPEGYCRNLDIVIHVDDNWKAPELIKVVNVPDHYEFLKTDSSGNPLAGVKFRLEDEQGTNLGFYESDENGVVSITGLDMGTYYIRETETLEGFSVSGEVIKIVLDENYVIPENLPRMINYTIIQTGVRIAVTGVMILGAVFVVASGILLIIRKKKNSKKQED